jgi:hypothetical protein
MRLRLPSGLSYSDATGLITGTPTQIEASQVTFTVTNSAGQSKVLSATVSIGAASYAYESWSGPGWFDISDAATITLSGSNITAIANKRSGGGNLTGAGTASERQLASGAQNGRDALRLTRDTSSNAPRFVSLSTDPVAQAFQGDDHAYTVIVAYKPTDANTGFPFSAVNSYTTAPNELIGLVRRSATASSVRRQLLSGTPNDVSWGSGQASGTARVVAIKHSGTAVTVWDNSATTKSLDAQAQNVATYGTSLLFMLGAGIQGSHCAMDWFECVVESNAKSDADIQQAVTDLAEKWGVTLS